MTVPQKDLRRMTLPCGYEIIRQGDYGGQAWLIEDGQMEVLVEEAGVMRQIAVVGRGAVVGEMALIDDGVRSATVRTLNEVTCVEITRGTFKELLTQCQPLAAYMLESLVASIRRARGLPQDERRVGSPTIRSVHVFSKVLDRRVYKAGHLFFQQGEPGLSAYLIQNGRVSIQRTSGGLFQELGQLGPGRIFGELALINATPRLATAVALEPTVCEIITRDRFDAAIGSMSPILRALTKIYVNRLVSLARR